MSLVENGKILVLDRLREREAGRLNAINMLETIAKEFPEVIDAFIKSLWEEEYGVVKAEEKAPEATLSRVGRRARTGTAYHRISQVFLANPDTWLSTSFLAEQSNVARNAVAHVLWSANKSDFEQRAHPTHKRMKVWRMSAEALDRIKKQNRLFQTVPTSEEMP